MDGEDSEMEKRDITLTLSYEDKELVLYALQLFVDGIHHSGISCKGDKEAFEAGVRLIEDIDMKFGFDVPEMG